MTKKKKLEKGFFVVVRGYWGHALPLQATDNDSLELFPTYEAAEKYAKSTPHGEAYGYKIYEW